MSAYQTIRVSVKSETLMKKSLTAEAAHQRAAFKNITMFLAAPRLRPELRLAMGTRIFTLDYNKSDMSHLLKQ